MPTFKTLKYDRNFSLENVRQLFHENGMIDHVLENLSQ